MTSSHAPRPAAAPDLASLLEDALPQPVAARPAAVLIGPSRHAAFVLTPDDRAVLDAALGERGLAPVLASPGVTFGHLAARRLPRDVAWTQYPLVGGPFWRAGSLHSQFVMNHPEGERFGPAGRGSAAAHAADLVRQAPALVIMGDVGDAAMLDLHRLLGVVPGGRDMPVYAWDRRGPGGANGPLRLRDCAPDLEAAAARDRARLALDRFLWSYEANFLALGAKALQACGVDADMPDRRWMAAMSHPWAVQILFALRRADEGRWEGRPLAPRGHYRDWEGGGPRQLAEMRSAYFPGMVLVPRRHEPAVGGEVDNGDEAVQAEAMALCWPGSGRWPVLEGGHDAWRDRPAFEDACSALFGMGLVRLPPRDVARTAPAVLTEKGRAFLELLHPDMEDPDMMLRWRRGEDGLPTQDLIPAMDRWVNDAFRKLKRRLSLATAAPEPGGPRP